MGHILRVTVAALAAVLCTASSADAMGYMVVEETCERRMDVPAQQPCSQPAQPAAVPIAVPTYYPVPYPVQVAEHGAAHHGGAHHGGSIQVPYKQEGVCSCGGSKHDGTCTCQKERTCSCKKESTCGCGGSKHDGTCTCGNKQDKKKDELCVKGLAEEGLTTLFKVMRGGMKMVEHLADHMNKKAAYHAAHVAQVAQCKKPCGGPAVPACGCGGCGPAGGCPCKCC